LGDVVTVGQPLVTLDTAEFELMVAQAEAQLAQARAAVGIDKAEDDSKLNPENSPPVRQQRAVWDEAKASLDRSRRLLDQAAISPGEFGVIEAAERVAAAGYAAAINSAEEKISMIGIRRVELDLAKQRRQDAVIAAPFDGLVQGRLVAPGGFIAAGDSVVTLVRTDPIWFRGLLPERYATKLKVGQSLRFSTESIDAPVAAVVTRISPSLELSSRALAFEARVDNPELRFRSGVFATAELVIEPEASAVAIPATAVSQFAGAEKVWKLVEGIAREAEIVSGGRRDGMVEITQGLVVGDVILADASIGKVAKILAPKSATAAAPEAASTPATTATPASGIGTLVEKQGN
jgi:RND family efflux transporter MFP subunit